MLKSLADITVTSIYNKNVNGCVVIYIIMQIKLSAIAKQILSEGGKLFGSRSERVTTSEMRQVYDELKSKVGDQFARFTLSRSLASKQDHGDVDIVVSGISGDVESMLKARLGKLVLDYHKNGNIYSMLYLSGRVGKSVHVDLIKAPSGEHDTQVDYLAYNDFSAIVGIISRRLGFSYSTDGFFKTYVDKRGNHHHILITKNLRDGLKMLGYGKVLPKFDEIKTVDDIVHFISSSDLFDSSIFSADDFNRTDRRRVRPERKIAGEIKDKLVATGKHRTQPDSDYYFKKLFPTQYAKYTEAVEKIESEVPIKSKFNGKWIMANFPSVRPGPIIKHIQLHLQTKFGDALVNGDENVVKAAVEDYLKVNPVG